MPPERPRQTRCRSQRRLRRSYGRPAVRRSLPPAGNQSPPLQAPPRLQSGDDRVAGHRDPIVVQQFVAFGFGEQGACHGERYSCREYYRGRVNEDCAGLVLDRVLDPMAQQVVGVITGMGIIPAPPGLSTIPSLFQSLARHPLRDCSPAPIPGNISIPSAGYGANVFPFIAIFFNFFNSFFV